VLGDGSDPQLVAELADIEIADTRTAGDELRGSAILDPASSLRFAHPLVRSAVYESIRGGERSDAHMRAVGALRSAGASPERIATQLLAAEPRGDREAVETLIAVAEGAIATGAPRSAIAYLERALEEPPHEDVREVVLSLLMTAAFRAADHAAWARVEPAVLAELERKPSLRISWATTLTMAMAMGGRFEEAASLLAKAVDVANAEGEVGRAFELEAQLATLAQIVPSVPAVDLTRYAGEIDLDGPGGRLAAALEARAAAVAGSAGQAADAAKLALGNDGVIFDEEPELVAAVMSVMILVAADEVDAAHRAAERALAIALERDIAPGIARGLSLRGFAAWAYGDLVNAEADMRQAVDLVRLAGIAPLVLVFSGPLIAISVERDELRSAEAQLEALGMADGPMPGNPMFSLLRMVRGQLRFERGELERSLEDLLVFCTQADHLGPSAAATCSPWVIRGLIAAGERSRAQEIASAVKARAERWGAPATVAQAMRADAIATGGNEGIAILERAVALLENSSRRLERAHALVDLGEALRREGRRAEAREPLREALRLARQGGAVRVAKRANDELQATGEKVRSYAPIGVESLTPSERRVAELAASGMTNRQIAQSLFVTVKTVEAHLSAAYDKLDIDSRRQLPGALQEPGFPE